MLPLDDERWTDLIDAYHNDSCIPLKLRKLRNETQTDTGGCGVLWEEIWSALCHQGDVYSASYAAVPHIVDIACATKGPISFNFFLFPASVEVARNAERGPVVPDFLCDGYFNAIRRLPEAVVCHIDKQWSRSMLLSIAAAQAVAKQHFDIAECMMNLDDFWIKNLIEFDD